MADDLSKSGGIRPSVLSLTISQKSALYAAYIPHLKRGGIFVPTTRPYRLGDEVFMLLTLMDDPNKLPVAGQVVWVTPANCQGNKAQGIGVQFSDDENGQPGKRRREAVLGRLRDCTQPRARYSVMLVGDQCHRGVDEDRDRLRQPQEEMAGVSASRAKCISVTLRD